MYYSSLIHLHALIGLSALLTFWVAALSRKGSKPHRIAGKLYIGSMIGILLSVLPMIALKVTQAEYAFAVLLGYLFLVAFTATYVTWQSIRQKKSVAAYHSVFFKWIATLLTAYGLSILVMGILFQSFLQMVFASVGISLGTSMWWNVLRQKRSSNWYLAQHMNGVAINFAATHGSFLKFGLISLLAIPDTVEVNTFSQTSMIILAFVLRWALGRIYLNNRQQKTNHRLIKM